MEQAAQNATHNEDERERKRERVRESGLASTCCTPLSVSSPFVLLLIRCPHGTVLLVMVGTSTWQLGWKVGSTLRCRMVLPEVQYWSLVEAYGLQTLCECHERRFGYPAVVYSGKFAVLEKTLAGMGDDEPILAGKTVLEKELEKLQKKLNGPKKTAKHIEAKQNWISRESKRLEVESAKLTEWQESLRARQETLKVAYEEIKILSEDLLRVESKKRKLQETIEKESKKDARMGDDPWMVVMVLRRHEGANTDIASNFRVETT